jgi:hypothetical protein
LFLSFDFLFITGLGPKVFESVLAHLTFWAPITCDKEIKARTGSLEENEDDTKELEKRRRRLYVFTVFFVFFF